LNPLPIAQIGNFPLKAAKRIFLHHGVPHPGIAGFRMVDSLVLETRNPT
jgi:hypothetical protein